jgi:hypothetical protein
MNTYLEHPPLPLLIVVVGECYAKWFEEGKGKLRAKQTAAQIVGWVE